MMEAHALLIRATKDSFCELDVVSQLFKYHGVSPTELDLTFGERLLDREPVISSQQWTYVYVCGHGNEEGFGEAGPDSYSDPLVWETWSEFSELICDRLEPGATVLTACCRGGFEQVAWQIFTECKQVGLVTGPRFNVTESTLNAGFTAFLHHIEHKKNDPTVAVAAATAASGAEFLSYDRLETESSQRYTDWLAARSDNDQSLNGHAAPKVPRASMVSPSE